MNYSNLIKIAVHALLQNKFRAFLTMLGIIIGVGSVIAMLGIGQGSKKSIQDQMSKMGTNLIFIVPASQQRGGIEFGNANAQSLKLGDVEAIRRNCEDVSAVSPEVRSSGQVVYGNKNWPTTIYGGNEEYFSIRKIDIVNGRNFTDREIKSMAKVCLVGQTVIKNLWGENYDPVGLTIRFKNIPFKVIGVLGAKGEQSFGQDQDDVIIAPYTTVQKRVLTIDHIQSIYTSAVSEERTDEAIKEIEQILRQQHKLKESEENDFRIMSQSELVTTFTSVSDILTTLLGAIAGISLLVGGIGIMNIMLVSVTERTREIGLRMSVGGRGLDIMMQFLVESMLLSIFGGVIGIVMGILATKIIGSVMSWPVVVMSQAVILAFVVCTAIGIFFGWYPARKAANLNPIDAIRYE
jgi:putative ABC transport system permease protein